LLFFHLPIATKKEVTTLVMMHHWFTIMPAQLIVQEWLVAMEKPIAMLVKQHDKEYALNKANRKWAIN